MHTRTFSGRASTLATSLCPIKRETLVRPVLLVALVLLLVGAAWGQIDMPDEVPLGEPIVCTVKLEGVPDGAEWKQAVVPDITGDCHVEPGPAPNVFHIWGLPGEYTVEVFGMWGLRDPEKPTSWIDFGFVKDRRKFKITGSVTPDPQPVVNPYKPAPAYQAAVEPVTSLSLGQSDSHALAALYFSAATQVRAGAYKSLGEIRADLIKRGQRLNLKGKYDGLPQAVESYLQTTIGREEVVPAASVGDVFETLAWAVWRDR